MSYRKSPDLQRTTVIQEFVLSFSDWPVYNRRRKNQKTCLLVQRKESSEKDLGGWRSQTSFTMRSLESVGVTLQFEHSNPTAAAVVPSRRSHQQTQHFDILEATLIKMSSSSSLSRSLSLSESHSLSLFYRNLYVLPSLLQHDIVHYLLLVLIGVLTPWCGWHIEGGGEEGTELERERGREREG